MYHKLSKYDEAMKYYLKAMKIKENKLGIDHVDTAKTYNNIGNVYHV